LRESADGYSSLNATDAIPVLDTADIYAAVISIAIFDACLMGIATCRFLGGESRIWLQD
jgi:hypothetical protein